MADDASRDESEEVDDGRYPDMSWRDELDAAVAAKDWKRVFPIVFVAMRRSFGAAYRKLVAFRETLKAMPTDPAMFRDLVRRDSAEAADFSAAALFATIEVGRILLQDEAPKARVPSSDEIVAALRAEIRIKGYEDMVGEYMRSGMVAGNEIVRAMAQVLDATNNWDFGDTGRREVNEALSVALHVLPSRVTTLRAAAVVFDGMAIVDPE